MSKKVNIINNVITFALTLGAMFLAVFFIRDNYADGIGSIILYFIIGAIIGGFLNTLFHELGHVLSGKRNKFKFSAMTVWFFKWKRIRGKIDFSLKMMGSEAGYTEMIPTDSACAKKGFVRMTRGGIIASFIMLLVSIVPLFLTSYLPFAVYAIWSSWLPISAYFFFGTVLPMQSGPAKNDGAVLWGFKRNLDEAKVTESLLKIQAEMYNGKTPGEVEEELYFNLPQLPEDNLMFANLLNARYNYYLDKGDYENAKKITSRLLALTDDYLPKELAFVVKTDALYNACTFDYNEDLADEYMYDVEDYINADNSITNVRVKLAYLLYVRKELEPMEMFFSKAEREIKRCSLKGQGAFEEKLINKIKEDIKLEEKNPEE